MYSAIDIAKYIIARCNENGKTISNLKLQKILYFVQAEFLTVKDQPCFYEQIEAWDFGPVVPIVYHEYKVFGCASIPDISLDQPIINQNDTDLLNGIIDECSDYSASELVEITHNQAPWKDAYRQYHNAIISNESIKEFFTEG